MSVISPGSSLVVDASVAVRAVIPTPAARVAIARFEEWRRRGLRLVAPSLWLAEAVSAIRMATRAGVIDLAEGREAIDHLFRLEIETVADTRDRCLAALAWAERLGQSRAYDGFYLALAEELNAEFWTADQRLANAARQVGANWVHPAV